MKSTAPFGGRPGAADRRQAFKAAQQAFLQWLSDEAPRSLALPEDRESFNRLFKAAKDLDDALQGFSDSSSNGALLVALMQRAEGLNHPQRVYRQLLASMTEQVGLVRQAAAFVAGRGLLSDLNARAWVWAAADSWRDVMRARPSAADGGAFWVALDEFQESGDRSPRVPHLSRKAVVVALKLWPGHDRPVRGAERDVL
jgi:hypothetical protein